MTNEVCQVLFLSVLPFSPRLLIGLSRMRLNDLKRDAKLNKAQSYSEFKIRMGGTRIDIRKFKTPTQTREQAGKRGQTTQNITKIVTTIMNLWKKGVPVYLFICHGVTILADESQREKYSYSHDPYF